MNRIYIIIAFYIIFTNSINAQNFDWQNSDRMPFESSKLFIGLSGEINNYNHNGNFSFIEKNTPCCSYLAGKGIGYKLGVASNYILNDEFSIVNSLTFKSTNANFTALNSYPKSPNLNLVTEFQFQSNIKYISLETLIKRVLLESNVNVLFGFEFDVLISNDFKHKEIVVSPSNFRFNDNSVERSISEGRIDQLNSFIVNPKIALNYDINIANNKFLSNNLILNIPLMSVIQNENWKPFSIGLNSTLFFTL